MIGIKTNTRIKLERTLGVGPVLGPRPELGLRPVMGLGNHFYIWADNRTGTRMTTTRLEKGLMQRICLKYIEEKKNQI